MTAFVHSNTNDRPRETAAAGVLNRAERVARLDPLVAFVKVESEIDVTDSRDERRESAELIERRAGTHSLKQSELYRGRAENRVEYNVAIESAQRRAAEVDRLGEIATGEQRAIADPQRRTHRWVVKI